MSKQGKGDLGDALISIHRTDKGTTMQPSRALADAFGWARNATFFPADKTKKPHLVGKVEKATKAERRKLFVKD